VQALLCVGNGPDGLTGWPEPVWPEGGFRNRTALEVLLCSSNVPCGTPRLENIPGSSKIFYWLTPQKNVLLQVLDITLTFKKTGDNNNVS